MKNFYQFFACLTKLIPKLIFVKVNFNLLHIISNVFWGKVRINYPIQASIKQFVWCLSVSILILFGENISSFGQSCVNSNSSFENGTFSSFTTSNSNINGTLTTYGGSQAIFLSADPGGSTINDKPVTGFNINTGYWIDATTNGGLGAKDGNRLFLIQSGVGANKCLWPNTGMGFTYVANNCYKICIWVAQFDASRPNNVSLSTQYNFEFYDLWGAGTAGVPSNFSITPNSISADVVQWTLPPSTNVKDKTGAVYTGASGQVVDWKTLNWQQICFDFKPSVDESRLNIYNSTSSLNNGIALDGFCIASSCIIASCTPPTAVTAGSNSPVNQGSAINLTSSSTGGTSYSWSGPNSFTSTLQNPSIASGTSLMGGTYTVTVLSSGTCTATATMSVVVTPSCTPPTAVTASSNSPVNAGSAINLTSSSTGGTSYLWSGPNSFTSTSQNPSIASGTSLMSGIYTVTVLSSGTCTATATMSVVVTPSCTPPTSLTAGSNSPVNAGSTINLTSGSTGGTSYSWSGPNSFTSTLQNPSIASGTSLMGGTYTVTVLSSGTCTATATTAVVVMPSCTPPTSLTAGSNSPVNQGSAINLTSSSTGGTSYSWSGPNSFTSTLQNPSIASGTSLMGGTYTVTVLSSGTCTATATTAVVVTPTCTPPTTVTAGSNSPVNQGSAINLTSSSTGGTSYSWSGPNSFTSTLQNPSIASGTSLMGGTYTVTVLSSGTCTATATMSVVVTPSCTPPTSLTAGSNSPVNAGSTINLTSSSTGGTSYSWKGPNSFISTLQNPSIASGTSLMGGTYTVTVLSSGTCTATATMSVVVTPSCTPPTAVTASSNSPVNQGSAINLTSSSIGGTSYSWKGPNSFISTSQNPSIASGTSLMGGTYTVTVLSSGTCTATATTAVIVTPTTIPPVDLALTKTILSSDCKKQIGDNVVFKLVVKRQDLETISVSGISVKDSLSTFLTFVSATATKGTYDNNTKLWSGITLAQGDSAVLQVTTKISATNGFYGGLACNEAWIQTMNGTDIDSQVGNKSELEDDYARACVSVPIKICQERGEMVIISAPSGYTSYQWYDYATGQSIAGATSKDYTLTKSGSYSVKVNGSICPNNSCCPIYVEDFCDCLPNICVPFVIQKTKTRTK